MHRKIVAGVSSLLFALMAILASIVTDVHDRSLPHELGARAAVTLDYSETAIPDQDAFAQLADASDRFDLGLVKIVPEMRGDRSRQVVVVFGEKTSFPKQIEWFGVHSDSPVVDPSHLSNSYATGQYLVTGDKAQIEQFRTLIADQNVGAVWNFDSAGTSLRFVLSQASFAASMFSAVILMAVLVLYWFSVKARGRSLRVLSGTPSRRIHFEDLTGLLIPIVIGALLCNIVAAAYIGIVHGWAHVPYYLQVMLMLETIVIAATMLIATAVSAYSWPSAAMLARRQPAVKSLRAAATVMKSVTLVLVLAAAAPTASALSETQKTAQQQAMWNSLADQVSVGFAPEAGAGGPDGGFEELMGRMGEMVMDAQAGELAALSYTWEQDYLKQSLADAGTFEGLSLVNHRWLEMMQVGLDDSAEGLRLERITPEQIPPGVRDFLSSGMELWTREGLAGDQTLQHLAFYEYSGSGAIPLAAGGSGDLLFMNAPLVAVVEDLKVFNDDFLISAASSSNLTFTGLGPMQELAAQHELQDDAIMRYVAEEGLLRAQLTAYFAWLQGISLIALSAALIVSTAIGALITAATKARRDFPLRLSGMAWRQILGERIVKEWAVVVGLAAAVIVFLLWRGSDYLILTAAVAMAALALSPVAHTLAARWSFNTVSFRKL